MKNRKERKKTFVSITPFSICIFFSMFRFKTISSLLFFAAAILVCFVFILHLFAPSYQSSDNGINPSNQRKPAFPFVLQHWIQSEEEAEVTTTIFIPPKDNQIITPPTIKCRENLITIEQYRARSVIRGVIVRFPSFNSDYYFVQFRWFYRSWIESEMFTLDRWRTDLIILIDDQFPNKTRQFLEHLDCHMENQRKSRRQISRCILVNHKLFSQRTESERQSYISKYKKLGNTNEIDANIDRLFSIYDYISQLNASGTIMYDFLMVTTMNTFLTTQFGKYIPLKCIFLIGASPDYTTWYSKPDQILQYVDTLLYTLQDYGNVTTDFSATMDKLEKTFIFTENQVDIPCDSKQTTYRTSVYHIKCYAHSTSLFSERLFRENAYDGFEKEPFNIYIAREYATLMALQSKVMSLDDLHSLAVNVTRREVFT